MFEISGGPVDCPVPDDLTIPQFFLDSHHPLRPARQAGVPWLIDDATGRSVDLEEVRVRPPHDVRQFSYRPSCARGRSGSRMRSRHGMGSVSDECADACSLPSHTVRSIQRKTTLVRQHRLPARSFRVCSSLCASGHIQPEPCRCVPTSFGRQDNLICAIIPVPFRLPPCDVGDA